MPVDFGWVIQPVPVAGVDAAGLLDYNRAAIRALSERFTTIWMEDHFQWGEKAVLEAWTTLTFLAAEFPQKQFGHIVLGQSYRNPALTAKMGANLQLLTGGRFIMGIGAGWKEDEYRAYGYDYPRPPIRIGQLRDTIAIMRAMWTTSPANYQGEYYAIHDAHCEPRPQPMIPIHVGGSGEKGTLRVVAEAADAWNIGFASPEEIAHKITVLHSHCAAVGRDPATLAMTYYGVLDLPEDPANAPQREFFTLGPTPADAIAQLRAIVSLGISHILLRTPSLATLDRCQREIIPYVE